MRTINLGMVICALVALAPAAHAQDDKIPAGLHPFSEGEAFTVDDREFILDYHFIYQGAGPEVLAKDKPMMARLSRTATTDLFNTCQAEFAASYVDQLAIAKVIYEKYPPRIAKYQALRSLVDIVIAFHSPSSLADLRIAIVRERSERPKWAAEVAKETKPLWHLDYVVHKSTNELIICTYAAKAKVAFGATI